MRANPTTPAVVVGSIAAAATTGALVAMGHRAGHVAIPFASIGAALFQRSGSGAVGLVFTGFVLNVVANFLWAVVYVWVAQRTRRPITSACVVAIANFLGAWLVASATGHGIASVLALGDRVVFAVILAGAYVVGMRYAFPQLRNA